MRAPRLPAVGLRFALALGVAASCSADALAQTPAPPVPAVLVATPTFLMYAEGDRRQPAVAGASATGYRIAGYGPDGSVFVGFDDGALTSVEAITPSLTTRTVKTFARGTAVLRAEGGFLAWDTSSQLVRRYDARGGLVGAPVVSLGMTEALGVGDVIATLGNGRLRVFERTGRERKEINLAGNSLTLLPDGRFAVNDAGDGEVRVYTTNLDQVAVLRYVGLPVRALAAAPDGTLAVLAGTPACVTSNAEIDVFTDLHAQPAARIHAGVTSATLIALDRDTVYAVNAPCRTDADAAINAFARDGTPRGTLNNVGVPTSIIPFRRGSS